MKFFLAVAVFLASLPASAGYPYYAEYTRDGSRLFWFMQITDTHIDTALPGEEDNLAWALGAARGVIAPEFVAVTGDLSDSTNGVVYGTGPHREEWEKYMEIVDAAGVTADFYFDLPGNHDQYGDSDLSFYKEYSLQGRADGAAQHSWRLDLPFGSYHFFGAATPGNDGAQWPADNKEFTAEEIAEFEDALIENQDARLSFALGHHDFAGVKNAGPFRDLMTANGVVFYMHGHEHDTQITLGDDGVVRFRIDSLGQGLGNNVAVYAVDADAVSQALASAQRPWPLVVVTAPVDAALGPHDEVSNPYAPEVPTTCESAPVRVLVFDAVRVGTVRFRIDGGEWTGMTQRRDNPAQWRGSFASTGLTAGIHSLSIEASGSRTVEVKVQVNFAEAPCEIGDEDPDVPVEPVDAGMDGGPAFDGGREDAGGRDAAGPDAGPGKDAGAADAVNDAGAGDVADGGADATGDSAGSDEEGEGSKAGEGCSCGSGGAGDGYGAILGLFALYAAARKRRSRYRLRGLWIRENRLGLRSLSSSESLPAAASRS